MSNPWAPPSEWRTQPPYATAPLPPGGWGAQPRRQRLPGRVFGIALALLVLLPVGATAAVRLHRLDQLRAELLTAVPRLQEFVEEASGRPFREEVTVEVLDDRAFEAALLSGGTEPVETKGDPEDVGATLTALGMVDSPESFEEQISELTTGGTLGFYDTETGRLVVRATQRGPFLESVLVHELTHALQDQYTDLGRIDRMPTDTEASSAFLALVEGDATRVEQSFRAGLSPALRERADREEQQLYADAGFDESGDPVVAALASFPYGPGLDLAEAVVAERGVEGIAEALEDPPATTEQVLHPEAYLEGEEALDVDRPEAGGDVVDRGVLGELGLALLLAGGDTDQVGEPAIVGWGGDAYVTTDRDGRSCTVADVRMDTTLDRDELFSALRAWAEAQEEATVEPRGSDALRLAACAG